MAKLEDILTRLNVADLLDDEKLQEIGEEVCNGYELDKKSISEWLENNEKSLELAKQNAEEKMKNGSKVANIKYPLISTAAINFASRAYPEFIQKGKVVFAAPVGPDPLEVLTQRSTRVARFMSFQMLELMKGWELETQKLFTILSIVGTVFRKTYYDAVAGETKSDLCLPDEIVTNYHIKSLKAARRVTHKIYLYANDIVERQRAGIYREVDIETLKHNDDYEDGEISVEDRDAPIPLLEQHCYLDLDDDGYREPYIVILHPQSKEVLYITPRFEIDDVVYVDERRSKILKIEPIHYFTDYHYLPSPDGGFYSMGLGGLLRHTNEALNTLLNQIVDGGQLANSQSGFLGAGLRLRQGEIRLRRNEWKVLAAAPGHVLKDNIVPIPSREPSPVLFNSLKLLLDAGQDLANTQDTMQGKGPTQNVPATTILTMVEQGMKMYTAIHKGLYRSFKEEFLKVFELNRKYLDDKLYQQYHNSPEVTVGVDFQGAGLEVRPVADPSISSDAQRLARAQAIASVPGVDPYLASKLMLEAMQVEPQQIAKLLPPPDPNTPPPAEEQKIQMEINEIKSRIANMQFENEYKIMDLRVRHDQVRAYGEEAKARIQKMQHDAMVNEMKLENVMNKQGIESYHKQGDQELKARNDEFDARLRAAELSLKAQQAEDAAENEELKRAAEFERNEIDEAKQNTEMAKEAMKQSVELQKLQQQQKEARKNEKGRDKPRKPKGLEE